MAERTEAPLLGPASDSSRSKPLHSDSAAAPLKAPETAPTTSTASAASTAVAKPKPFHPPRRKYALPLPVRTFPLPTFYPSNPVSLVYLAYAWLGQVLAPPPPEPATVYEGVWSPATRSVQVTDPKSMNDLWCQGFYGKGSLSRSEPNWLNREKARRGLLGATSEQRTNKRREERADTKWERGRTELEAIEQRRRDEVADAEAKATAKQQSSSDGLVNGMEPNGRVVLPTESPSSPPKLPIMLFKAPVGPLELLALPNSEADLRDAIAAAKATAAAATVGEHEPHFNGSASAAAPTETTVGALKADVNDSSASLQDVIINGVGEHHETNGSAKTEPLTNGTTTKSYGDPGNGDCNGTSTATAEPLKRQKSVRFSPTVKSTTFLHSDPPSPNHSSLALSPKRTAATANGHSSSSTGNSSAGSAASAAQHATADQPAVEDVVQNMEHLQLSVEEAFFLAYAIGALRVMDPDTQQAMTTQRLFTLCRQYSYFPPRTSPNTSLSPPLSTDDPFLVHYVVYHHFRSLGWVPRHGIKFGVDWMLYGKGPALDHAEFGVMVVPSYTDAWWKKEGEEDGDNGETRGGQRQRPAPKSWHWLHSVNRVLSTVYKSLVLVYVDIPPPVTNDGDNGDAEVDISALLARYRIREVMIRRWSSNRNRD